MHDHIKLKLPEAVQEIRLFPFSWGEAAVYLREIVFVSHLRQDQQYAAKFAKL